RTAERIARLQVLPVLIEYFDAMVAAVGHPQPAARVERQRVRRAELAVLDADAAPRFDEFPVGGELADARRRAALESFGDGRRRDHPLRVVAVGDVDAAAV